MKKKILIVEDDEKIVDLISLYFKKEGFDVSTAKDGRKGLEKVEQERPDLVILDLMLPKMDGFQVAKSIRSRSNLPIIILTAKDEEVDKVMGLELGADDYVVKPFSPKELMARTKAILRRLHPENKDQKKDVVRMKNIEIDPEKFTVKKDSSYINLSVREFNLLMVFAQNPGRVFSRSDLMHQIYTFDDKVVFDRTIDVHIANLRRKLNDKKQEIIITVSGVGYKLNE
ncbi:MAG: response regulator transcription factor [Patescibacteria group bacterium]